MQEPELNEILVPITPVLRPVATLTAHQDLVELLEPSGPAKKLSTFQGVTVPTCEFMWSVLLFVRFGYLAGDAGVLMSCFVIVVSALSVSLTASSIAAITTNGLPTGGVYRILGKSLGRGMGGSICLLSYLGITLLISVEIVGSVHGFLQALPLARHLIFANAYWNQVAISLLTLVAALAIVMCGKFIVSKVAVAFLAGLLVSFVSMIVGLIVSHENSRDNSLVTGLSLETLYENLKPVDNLQFGPWFSLILPCYVGILTGVNNASHLATPLTSIPAGMFSSISISSGLYVALIVLFGSAVKRAELLSNEIIGPELAWPSKWIAIPGVYIVGLGASLQCLIMASSILHSLSIDDIVPLGRQLGLDRLWRGEPRAAILFTTFLVLPLLFIEDLDVLIEWTAMCFLLCDASTNFICFTLNEFKSPNWRPKFRYSNRWTSIIGCLLCLVLMFEIEWYAAVISIALVILVAYLIQTSSSSLSWGQGMHGLIFHIMVRYLVAVEEQDFRLKLTQFLDETRRFRRRETFGMASDIPKDAVGALLPKKFSGRVWRPQVVCFVKMSIDSEICEPNMIAFISQLRSRSALCILVNVLAKDEELARIQAFVKSRKRLEDLETHLAQHSPADHRKPGHGVYSTASIHDSNLTRRETRDMIDEILLERKLKLQQAMEEHGILGFAKVLSAPKVRIGQRIFLQTMGLGELTPNTAVIDWPSKKEPAEKRELLHHLEEIWQLAKRMDLACLICKGVANFPGNNEELSGNIDVWWIVQEGQLLLMIAYLLKQHSVWRNCPIRLFAICHSSDELSEIEEELKEYLEIMRIRVDCLTVIPVELLDMAPEATPPQPPPPMPVPEASTKMSRLRDSAMARRMHNEIRLHGVHHNEYTDEEDEPLLGSSPTKQRHHHHTRSYSGHSSSISESEEAERLLFVNAKVIKELRYAMRTYSASADLVVYNLPAPEDTDDGRHGPYMDLIEWLTEGFERSVLVYASETLLTI